MKPPCSWAELNALGIPGWSREIGKSPCFIDTQDWHSGTHRPEWPDSCDWAVGLLWRSPKDSEWRDAACSLARPGPTGNMFLNPRAWGRKQEGQEFKVLLSYLVSLRPDIRSGLLGFCLFCFLFSDRVSHSGWGWSLTHYVIQVDSPASVSLGLQLQMYVTIQSYNFYSDFWQSDDFIFKSLIW